MPQYSIHLLEGRKDWPMIVTSVECPPPQQGGCGAAKGEFCKQLSTSLGTLGQQSQRPDFHAARKYAAAKFLEENPMPTPQSVAPESDKIMREEPQLEEPYNPPAPAKAKRTRKPKPVSTPTSE